ncbi:MAG: SO2930 family diheme c-type cytochrome [Gammaproteobacteria bacterium]
MTATRGNSRDGRRTRLAASAAACAVVAAAFTAAVALVGCTARDRGPDPARLLAGPPPSSLSAFDFFDAAPGAPLVPRARVEGYALVNALFSDHALKDRHVYLPPGSTIGLRADGVLDFPVGSAILKTFSLAPDLREPTCSAQRIETRVLVRRAEGWVAWPYVWNAAQTDATYAPVGARQAWEVTGPDGRPLRIDYRVPNQNQCKACHQHGDAITPIGPTARNLRAVRAGSQDLLADWQARGLLRATPEALGDIARVPSAVDATRPLASRARAWLDINCAHCHQRAGSASNSGLYLGWDEPMGTALGLGKRPVAAGRGAGDSLFVIDPGHPERSIMVHRMDSVEPGVAMPELGRSVHDPVGVALVAAWIASMPRSTP